MEVGELLGRLMKILKSENQSLTVEELHARLSEIIKLCRELGTEIKASDISSGSIKALEGLLESTSAKLEKGLTPTPPEKGVSRQMLEDLLSELSPYSGSRRVRPYELFLFASQNGLLKDKLVDTLSKLKAGFIPNPPHSSCLSILWAHKGATFNSELEE